MTLEYARKARAETERRAAAAAAAARLEREGPTARAKVAYCVAALAAAEAVPSAVARAPHFGGARGRDRGIKLREAWLAVARRDLARLEGDDRPHPVDDHTENRDKLDPGHQRRDKQLRAYVAALVKAARDGGELAALALARQQTTGKPGVIANGPSAVLTANAHWWPVAEPAAVKGDYDLPEGLPFEVEALAALEAEPTVQAAVRAAFVLRWTIASG